MSLKYKFISVFASAVILGSAAVSTSAQDQAPAIQDSTPKSEKRERKAFGRHDRAGKGMRGGFGKGMHRGGGMGLRGIELTDAQKTQLKQIHEANRPDQATMEELKAIREARRSGTLTEDQKARAAALRDQMRTKAGSVRQQVLAILTSEQRQQIETRKAEMQKRREEFRQQREQRRQRPTPPATTNESTDSN